MNPDTKPVILRVPQKTCAIHATIVAFVVSVSTAPVATGAPAASDDARLLQDAQRLFKPLPKDGATAEFPTTPERVELGRKLFFDPRMSIDGTVSCSRCHLAALYATDGLPKAKGAFDKVNDRRAPTVFNAALQFREHWRGDRRTLRIRPAGRSSARRALVIRTTTAPWRS